VAPWWTYDGPMRKFHVNLTDDQLRRLRAKSAADGLTLAEHLRRAVDAYATRTEEKQDGREETRPLPRRDLP
jgi:hypothetical protein